MTIVHEAMEKMHKVNITSLTSNPALAIIEKIDKLTSYLLVVFVLTVLSKLSTAASPVVSVAFEYTFSLLTARGSCQFAASESPLQRDPGLLQLEPWDTSHLLTAAYNNSKLYTKQIILSTLIWR